MFCKKCGAEIPAGKTRCPDCGALRDGLKFCQHCGEAIDKECVICPRCGKQVGQIKAEQPNIVINNSNANTNTNINHMGGFGRAKNKWAGFSRKSCVKADKQSSRKQEQIKGLLGQGTAQPNRAYPPVFRDEGRYARAA